MLAELIAKNRSYRRFVHEEKIDRQDLVALVDLARLSASAANFQPLKYIVSSGPETNDLILPCLVWAGYLKDWDGPTAEDRPAGYIVILGDSKIAKSFSYDAGIAAQSILLGAVEKSLGGCIFGSIDRDRLRGAFDIPEHLEILLVIALGKPREKVVIEPLGPDGDIKYWRDEQAVHHVPKRPIEEIIIG
ncbi:MAG: nitroreductase family protein [Phycisphaerae bacterium]|nr:nitroreductase family protein [Phycisphaerae bacterium]